jgi:hypothetical protein
MSCVPPVCDNYTLCRLIQQAGGFKSMTVRAIFNKLFGRRETRHLHCHAHVAEVYKCRCGHTFVRERK